MVFQQEERDKNGEEDLRAGARDHQVAAEELIVLPPMFEE